MLPIFMKPLEKLTSSDVDELVKDEFPEGSTVEYKEGLSFPQGKIDEWTVDRDISKNARDKILAEVVAFANAHGGNLLIGIKETKTKPSRAASVKPVPDCHNLAERLALQARDCVEPQVPLLTSCGIETDGTGGGVVLMRVERSYQAPHRLTSNRECYVRRADRTEKMTMREIQDLTLQIERGTSRVDSILRSRMDSFRAWLGIPVRAGMTSDWVGCRVTALPIWPLTVGPIYGASELFPLPRKLQLQHRHEILSLELPGYPQSERPILRGSQRPAEGGDIVQEMFSHGVSEIRFRLGREAGTRPTIYPEWVLGAAANTLIMVERFRNGVGAPAAEFALEIEVAQQHGDIRLYWAVSGQLVGDVIQNPCVFPRFSVGPPDKSGDLLGQLMNDLRNAAGVESHLGPFIFEIPE